MKTKHYIMRDGTPIFVGEVSNNIPLMPDTKGNLKQIYIALAKAIEEGDNLKIGIVIGQTLKELEDLINQP
jgi:hypothetical protein